MFLVDTEELRNVFIEFKRTGAQTKMNIEYFSRALFEYGIGMGLSQRFFQLFDTNRDGFVDLKEFVCGMSLLCKGTSEHKIECKKNVPITEF